MLYNVAWESLSSHIISAQVEVQSLWAVGATKVSGIGEQKGESRDQPDGGLTPSSATVFAV